MTNQWNAAQYDAKHAFVYEKAKGLVDLLAPKAGERILDLGCGTGALTAGIASRGAETLGVDQSEEMISQARKKFPTLKFDLLDARGRRFNAEFDAVFSSAVLHWIPEAVLVVAGVASRAVGSRSAESCISHDSGDRTSPLGRCDYAAPAGATSDRARFSKVNAAEIPTTTGGNPA